MYNASITFFLILSLYSGALAALFDLSYLQWTLKNQNGSIQIPARGPPSQAHLDLLNAGIITEPLFRINGECSSAYDCLRQKAKEFLKTLQSVGLSTKTGRIPPIYRLSRIP
jgi:hypothetical protein